MEAIRKLTALVRVRKYLDTDKTRILFMGLFESQFKYCQLIWMFCNRNTNNRINRYERHDDKHGQNI